MDRKYQGKLSAIVTRAPFLQGIKYDIFRFSEKTRKELGPKLGEYSRQEGVEIVEVYRCINQTASIFLAKAIDRVNEGQEVDFKKLLD